MCSLNLANAIVVDCVCVESCKVCCIMFVCIVVACVCVVVEPCRYCLCFFGCCKHVVPYVVVCVRSESCKWFVYLCVLLFVHVLLDLEVGV